MSKLSVLNRPGSRTGLPSLANLTVVGHDICALRCRWRDKTLTRRVEE